VTDVTISYVILCHRDAPQVLRLARTIRALSPRARVLIRHDQPPGFIDSDAASASGADLLISRIPCRWGSWSLVEASLEAFERARELHDPEWIVLISGQDYPVKPLEPWEETLLSGAHDAVVSGEQLVDGPSEICPRGNRSRLKLRYTHRWYWLPRLKLITRLPPSLRRPWRSFWFKFVYPLQALVVLNQLPRDEGWAIGIRRRAVPWSSDMPLFKGSQWMALSRRAAEICAESPHATEMRTWFARTMVPDEAYFHTLLASTPGLRIMREPISWLRWEADTAPHPVVIDEAELENARRAGTPFARKFDESANVGILDLVDTNLQFESGRELGGSVDSGRSSQVAVNSG
jgi:hypothetical protein